MVSLARVRFVKPWKHVVKQRIVIYISHIWHTIIHKTGKDRCQVLSILWAHCIIFRPYKVETKQHSAPPVILFLESLEVPELVQDVHRSVQIIKCSQRLSLHDFACLNFRLIVGAKDIYELFRIIVELILAPVVDLFLSAFGCPLIKLLVVD